MLRSLLNSLGYASNFPRPVVFGPSSHGGMGVHRLYVEQGCQKICQFVGHLRQTGRMADLLRIGLRWVQLVSGCELPVFQDTSRDISYVDNGWLTNLHRFMHEYDFHFDMTDVWSLYKQREHMSFSWISSATWVSVASS